MDAFLLSKNLAEYGLELNRPIDVRAYLCRHKWLKYYGVAKELTATVGIDESGVHITVSSVNAASRKKVVFDAIREHMASVVNLCIAEQTVYPAVFRKEEPVELPIEKPAEKLEEKPIFVEPPVLPVATPPLYDISADELRKATKSIPEDSGIQAIECSQKHLCGYIIAPYSVDSVTAVFWCHICNAVVNADPFVKPTVSQPIDIWKKYEEGKLAYWEKISHAIKSQFRDFSANRPKDPAAMLSSLMADFPYRDGEDMPPQTIYLACWLAHSLWPEDFWETLANLWGMKKHALRSRIERVWEWLDIDVQLQMPFMASACSRSAHFESRLQEAQLKLDGPKPVKWEPEVIESRMPPADWRTQAKLLKKANG